MPFDFTKMRKRRDKLKISRAALGREIGVDGQTVYRWEIGDRSPSLHHVDQIAAVLGIRPQELVCAEARP